MMQQQQHHSNMYMFGVLFFFLVVGDRNCGSFNDNSMSSPSTFGIRKNFQTVNLLKKCRKFWK
jgi:hypothetical protein